MQVQVANAPARTERAGETYFFCSDHCRERFTATPERHATGAPAEHDPKGSNP